MKILLLFFINISCIFAMNLGQIYNLPKSLAKDFVIFEYINSHDLSPDEAKKLYEQIFRKTYRLDLLFNKFIKNEKISCQILKPKEILKAKPNCAMLGLNVHKMQNTPLVLRKKIYKKLHKKYAKKLIWLKALNQKNIFKFLTNSHEEDFLKLFLGFSDDKRVKYLDEKLPLRFLSNLADKKNFEKFTLAVVMNENFKNLPKSLLKVRTDRKILSFNTAFYLGLLNLKHKKFKKAQKFFIKAQKLSDDENLKNKALFWTYQIDKNIQTLTRLANNNRLDLYSLYAKEKLNKPLFILTPNAPKKQSLSYFSHTDPFSWEATKNYIKDLNKTKLKEFAKQFYTKDTLPYFINLTQKINGWNENYFITPYEEFISNVNVERKILIYALARQESKCIPVVVSTSYALGLMQFMPFLAKNMAKQKGLKKFDYFDMFKPKIALDFANTHLDYLSSHLNHVAFIAYAYNGGIGFTTRMLKNTKLFNKGKFEPFLSLELVPYSESREYAKKVLVNYVIYSKIYGKNYTLNSLLKALRK